jgi:hypothetical protein
MRLSLSVVVIGLDFAMTAYRHNRSGDFILLQFVQHVNYVSHTAVYELPPASQPTQSTHQFLEHEQSVHDQCTANAAAVPHNRHMGRASPHATSSLRPFLGRLVAQLPCSGSEGDLYVANPNARAHFERVRLSTFAGSAVQRMMAANGSS